MCTIYSEVGNWVDSRYPFVDLFGSVLLLFDWIAADLAGVVAVLGVSGGGDGGTVCSYIYLSIYLVMDMPVM